MTPENEFHDNRYCSISNSDGTCAGIEKNNSDMTRIEHEKTRSNKYEKEILVALEKLKTVPVIEQQSYVDSFCNDFDCSMDGFDAAVILNNHVQV
jgi:hypothetical protein